MKPIYKYNNFNKNFYFPIIRALPFEINNFNILDKLKHYFIYLRKFQVIEDYILWCKYLQKFIFIPKGFVYNGASVPKILHNFLNSTGILFGGSCPHDFGYRYNGLFLIDERKVDREYNKNYEKEYHTINLNKKFYFQKFSKITLDKIFQKLCIQENNLKMGAVIATISLKCFGFIDWNMNRKNNLNCNHYQRFL